MQSVPLIGLYNKQESENQPVTVDVEVVEHKEEEEMEITVKDKKVEKRSEAASKEKPLSVIQAHRPSLTLLPPPGKQANDQFSDISDASDGEAERKVAISSPPKTVAKLPNGVIPTILTPSDQDEKTKLAQQPSLPSFDAVRSPQPQIVRDEKDPHRSVPNEEAVPDSQPSSPKDASTMRSNLLNSYPTPQVSLGPLGVANLTCNSMQNQRHSYAAGSQSTGKTKPSVVSSPKHSDHNHSPLNTLADMAVERSTQGAHSSRILSSGSSSSREDETKRDGGGDSQQADKLRGGHSVPSMIKLEPSSRATVAYVAPGSSHGLSDDTRDSDSSGSGSLSPHNRRRKPRKKNGEGGSRRSEQHQVGKEDAGRMPVAPAMIPFNFTVPCQPISPGAEGSHVDKLTAPVGSQHPMVVPVGSRPGNSSSPIPNRQGPLAMPSFATSREKETSSIVSIAGGSNKRVITNVSSAYPSPGQFFHPPSVLLGTDPDRDRRKKRAHETSNANPNKRPSPSPPIYSHEINTNKSNLPPLPASLSSLSSSGHYSLSHDQHMRRGNPPGFDYDPSLPMSFEMQMIAYQNQQQQQANRHHGGVMLDPLGGGKPPSSSGSRVVIPKRPRSTDPPPNRQQLIREPRLASPSSPANHRYTGDVVAAQGHRMNNFPTASIAPQRPSHIDSAPGRSHLPVRSSSNQQQQQSAKKQKRADLPPVAIKQEPEAQHLPHPWYLGGIPHQIAAGGIPFSPHIPHAQLPPTPPSSQPTITGPMAGIPQMPISWPPGVIHPGILQMPATKQQIKMEPSSGGRPSGAELAPPNSVHRTRSPSPSMNKKLQGNSSESHHHPSSSPVVIPVPTRPNDRQRPPRPQLVTSKGQPSSSSHTLGVSSSASSSSRGHPKETVAPRPQTHPHIQHPGLPQQSPTQIGK